jgi:hypothetical protein
MPLRPDPPRVKDPLQPLPAREIARRFDEIVESVARLAPSSAGRAPAPLTAAELMRCLAPYVSSN